MNVWFLSVWFWRNHWCFLESMQNVSEVCKLTKMILCHERNYLSMKYSVLWLVNILRLSYQRLLGIEYRMWHFVSWAPVEVHIEVAWLSIFEDDGLVPRIWRNCKFWPNLEKGFCVDQCCLRRICWVWGFNVENIVC